VSRFARARGTFWFLAGAGLIVFLGYAVANAFLKPENMGAPTFGTPWAPYSDALAPWLEGGVAFLFGETPPNYLYRPTIGLFWGSILAATERTAAIPAFFAAWLLAMLAAAAFFPRVSYVRQAVIVALALAALAFPDAWNTMYISSTAVDLPALAVTASGVVLLVAGRGPAALFAASACLGVAAAMRGPMMLAGIAMIVLRELWIERSAPRWLVAAAIVFVAPTLVDVLLQRHFGTTNNGLIAMYCFYSDPTHGWSAACNAQYSALKPSGVDVLQAYVGYVFSLAGLAQVIDFMSWRVGRDVVPLLDARTLVAVAVAAIFAAWGPAAMRRGLDSPLLRAVVLAAIFLGVKLLGPEHARAPLVAILAVLALAAALQLRMCVLCLAGYVTATLYLCLLGLHADRLQHTFSICMYLGIGLALVEASGHAAERPAGFSAFDRLVPAAICAVLLFLYAGSLFVPSDLRENYDREVRGKAGAAIKLGGDIRIDRSLYYSGNRQLIYTAFDDRPVASVRRYERLASDATSNASFVQPNRLVD
jgi:hypothetical protein